MNTSYAQNELYYGKAKATGLVKIRGDVNNIIMDITAKTEKGTEMVIPISSGTEVSESSFITFVNRDTISIEEEKEVNLSGITLNFDLEVTPEATMKILLDPEGEIEATGSGNIRLEITSLGAFNMYGDYIVDGGKYMFTLQNVIKKPFVIKKGGSISWHGDPYDAEVNIKAIYKVKTSLNDIQGIGMDSSSVNSKRIPVDCVLGLKGNLFSPEIKFNIDLPTSSDESKQLLYSAIDTTNELEVNKQMLSLIVINRFTSDESDLTLGEGFGSTSYELLSNQLSSWLSKISNDFDIGVNYRPGDKITSDELEVALSTQLFNNRVLIDGNFGLGGDQNTENQQKVSNIVGDVNIEVKITDDGRFRIKAFNRSNNDYFSDPLSPYTQGIGVFYRREFDKFEDLFNSKKKKQ